MRFSASAVGISLLFLGVCVQGRQSWVQTTAPAKSWTSISSSADGSCLVAAAGNGPIYISTNSGSTWILSSAPVTNWVRVASSAAGDAVFAVQTLASYGVVSTIYRSTNFGFTWFRLNAPATNWQSIACSADGTKLAACAAFGPIGLSTNAGDTWSLTYVTNAPWGDISCSADGTTLITTGFNIDLNYSPLAISTDAGTIWSVTNFHNWAFRAACSAKGENIILGAFNGLYVSKDSGATWQLTQLATNQWWTSVASSADGKRLITGRSRTSWGAISNLFYTSTDAGLTWTVNDAPNTNWNSVASSADGCKLVAAVGGSYSGFIYRAQSVPQPVLKTRLSGTQLILSWIMPSAPFVLQQTDDLSSPNWLDLPSVPVLNTATLENEVTVPLTKTNSFYRLKGVVKLARWN